MEATSVIDEGLRLLRECKVPQFCRSDANNPDELDRLQWEWSRRLSQWLPQLLDWIGQHRETLFDEEHGPVQWEFRKYFVLVYFEQVNQSLELAPFRLVNEDSDDLEYRLSTFKTEVDRILTKEANSTIRSWLFHYYERELGGAMEDWQCRPGEIFSVVRLCHFLVEHKRETDVRLGPRVVSFLEELGKKLLVYHQNPDYQMLGLMLTKSVMKHSYNSCCGETNDSEEILQLTLNLLGFTDDYDEDVLWDVVYYSVKFVRYPNSLLDDEIMRILVSLLGQETDRYQSSVYLKVLIQMLLLDLPEVKLEDFESESCSISGRKCDRREFQLHAKNRLNQNNVVERRISNLWRQRCGSRIPKLLVRFVKSEYDIYYLQGLIVLLSVAIFPIGPTRRLQRSQTKMMGSLLDGIHTKAKELKVTFERHPGLFTKEHFALYKNLYELYKTVCSGIEELGRVSTLSNVAQDQEVLSSLELRIDSAWKSLFRLSGTITVLILAKLEAQNAHTQAVDSVG